MPVGSVTCTVHMDALDPEAFEVLKVWGQASWSIMGGQQEDVRRVPEPAELVSPPDSDRPTWTPPLRYRR